MKKRRYLSFVIDIKAAAILFASPNVEMSADEVGRRLAISRSRAAASLSRLARRRIISAKIVTYRTRYRTIEYSHVYVFEEKKAVARKKSGLSTSFRACLGLTGK
jgi:predicted transcriptional regulator